ncbi:hypothetical protein B2G71_21520 [Novosphingobium sp. PC22D]|uniref:HWE histidine kinase domain-containing protein n=1 Tax=Novosphingobium sp. PC22D TaxID=1962403 RepID=UPI000BEFB583|nr:HWE histidine kinase domain-containing protein [Novosphingobium sp. PC22D]PEQ10565.1 hypothetical protein B2G71_21520 [Novosphingobium sp. PC22D]
MNGDPSESELLRQALADSEDLHRELIRHLRNVLAVIRALIRQPVSENGHDPHEYRARLEGRVDALTRVQSTLLRDRRMGTDLEGLVRDQLAMFGTQAEHEVVIKGRAIRLSPRATGLMALLIHELAIGTLEDGSHPISVSWKAGKANGLKLVWTDRGAGERDLQWIERAFDYELSGSLTTKLDGGARRFLACLPAAHLI